jgi:hypothetical protein
LAFVFDLRHRILAERVVAGLLNLGRVSHADLGVQVHFLVGLRCDQIKKRDNIAREIFQLAV